MLILQGKTPRLYAQRRGIFIMESLKIWAFIMMIGVGITSLIMEVRPLILVIGVLPYTIVFLCKAWEDYSEGENLEECKGEEEKPQI